MPRGIARPLSVQNVLEDLTGLEGEDSTGADRDLLARLRVASYTCILVTNHEVSEPGDLDLLSALECLFNRIEHRLDDLGSLLLGESTDLLVDVLNDVRLGHASSLKEGSRYRAMFLMSNIFPVLRGNKCGLANPTVS